MNGPWGVALALMWAVPAAAQVAVEGGAFVATGRYFFDEPTTTFTWTGGLSYTAGRLTLRATVPLVAQNTTLVTGSGTGLVPSGGSAAGMVSDSGRQRRGGQEGMRLQAPATAVTGYRAVLSDPVLAASVRLGTAVQTGLTAGVMVKVPVTDTSEFGTGALDVGVSVGLTRYLGPSVFLALDASYWYLGDLPDLDFRSPVGGTITAGRVSAGGWGVSVSLSGATPALDGYAPPVSIGAAVTRLRGRAAWSLWASAGLTETAAAVSAGATVRARL